MEKLKKCSKCSRELPVSEFWKNASTEDGLQTYCKECGNVYARNRKKTPGGGEFEENIFQSLIGKIFSTGTYRRIESTWIYRRIEIHPNNIIINGKVTSIGYNQMSEQMSYVLQQLMGFFKITSC